MTKLAIERLRLNWPPYIRFMTLWTIFLISMSTENFILIRENTNLCYPRIISTYVAKLLCQARTYTNTYPLGELYDFLQI